MMDVICLYTEKTGPCMTKYKMIVINGTPKERTKNNNNKILYILMNLAQRNNTRGDGTTAIKLIFIPKLLN